MSDSGSISGGDILKWEFTTCGMGMAFVSVEIQGRLVVVVVVVDNLICGKLQEFYFIVWLVDFAIVPDPLLLCCLIVLVFHPGVAFSSSSTQNVSYSERRTSWWRTCRHCCYQ